MKNLIFVNNNMKIGGVQKSLYNLLWNIYEDYDITLYLFSATGEYINKLPPTVKVEESKSLFNLLAISQQQAKEKGLLTRFLRAFLLAVCRVFSHEVSMKLISLSQRKLKGEYDCAISFLHNSNKKSFYGGTNEFVLNKINAKKKVSFVHCDFTLTNGATTENARLYKKFDKIAACSNGCKKAFCSCFPESADKCITVNNFHRFDEIFSLCQKDTVQYDKEKMNIVSVSRLSHEKGIDRAIEAVAHLVKNGCDIHYHIIGSGACEQKLKISAEEQGVKNNITFHAQTDNPYRFMVNADLLLISSYHEAAPMVIDEARALALPVLTTKTSSSYDMVVKEKCGFECEQSVSSIKEAIEKLYFQKETLQNTKKYIKSIKCDNSKAKQQFKKLIEN